MPTYTCWSTQGTISAENRQRIATAVTDIHHKVALAPRYFVQVLFPEVDGGGLFLAGRPAPEGHVWIRADIRSGRTVEQKSELLSRITGEVAEILGLRPDDVWVYLCDIPGHGMTEYGELLPEPGGEGEWFRALPERVRRRIEDLS